MPLKRPPTCNGCALDDLAYSFTTPVGPTNAKLLLVGEAAGASEAITGVPFSGPAGYKLNSLLGMAGIPRETVRIDNTIRCFASPKTSVLTQTGYKWISRIDPLTDLVLTHAGRWRRVLNVLHGKQEESWIRITTAVDKHTVTSDHKFLSPAKEWVAASDLRVGDGVLVKGVRCVWCNALYARSFRKDAEGSRPFCSVTCHNRWVADTYREVSHQSLFYADGPRDRFVVTKAANVEFVPVSVRDIEALPERSGSWSLHVEEDHSYVAQGILNKNCQPPANKLSGQWYEEPALEHCNQYIQTTLNEGHPVVVTLGGIPSRQLLGIPQSTSKAGITNLHGTVTRDAKDRFWIVPTFHPSFIQRGASNYTGVVVHDLLKAKEIAYNGFSLPKETLIVDPAVGAFQAWIDKLVQASMHNPGMWVAVDIETPEKVRGTDEDDLDDDPTYEITRINFAYEEHEAVTVPFIGQYVFGIQKILALTSVRFAFWNIEYDRPRLIYNHCPVAEPAFDLMWGWHMLQSDVPRALGFVAPFYSSRPPWKHLADASPGEYAAIDAIQTIRCAYGIERDLKASGMWDAYARHIYDLDRIVLRPAERVGLLMDRGDADKGIGLLGVQKKLDEMLSEIATKITEVVPQAVVPYEKELKTSRNAISTDGNLLPGFKEITKTTMGYVCEACGAENVPKGHTKTKKCQGAKLRFDEIVVTLWVKEGTFNSASPKQVKDYLKYKGYKIPRGKHTDETTDHQALEALQGKYKKDPFFKLILEDRAIRKLKGTYIDGMLKRQDAQGRVHCKYTHGPSTLRLSSRNPNLQNLITDGKKEDHLQLGKMFRKCVVASPGHVLVEADFAGIEAVLTGWFAADPDYIRIAKISPHAYLCSHMVGEPADVSWDDQKLREFLVGYIKKEKRFKVSYNKAKRVIHGSSYGLTPRGMRLTYPEEFPSISEAEKFQQLFFAIAPKVKEWQDKTVLLGDKQHYVGGNSHPFGYRHWFWDVIAKKYLKPAEARQRQAFGAKIVVVNGSHYEICLGTDAKRAIAFMPQSTASGILKEAALRLMQPDSEFFIGDLFNGETPIRMLIHDSIMLEVLADKEDRAIAMLVGAMSVPIKQMPMPTEWGLGSHLTIGVEVQRGTNWAEMEDVHA